MDLKLQAGKPGGDLEHGAICYGKYGILNFFSKSKVVCVNNPMSMCYFSLKNVG